MHNDMINRNEAKVIGRITYKRKAKNSNIFAVSVSRKTKRMREDGRPELKFRSIDVYFEGALGKLYDKMYKVGDYVVIDGIVQKTRNDLSGRSLVKIIGLSIAPKEKSSHLNDTGKVNIQGRISRSVTVNDDLLIVYIHSVVNKTFTNPNPEGIYKEFTDKFISDTPVMIWRSKEDEHDARELASLLTKGTCLEVSGYIDTRKGQTLEGRKWAEQRIVARDINVVGQIQQEYQIPSSFFFA